MSFNSLNCSYFRFNFRSPIGHQKHGYLIPPQEINKEGLLRRVNQDEYGTILFLRASKLKLCEEDKRKVVEVNEVTNIIKEEISPLIDFIKHDIFDNKTIMSQELVVNKKDNVLAKCDLSTEDKILEIKAFNIDIDKIKYQLY